VDGLRQPNPVYCGFATLSGARRSAGMRVRSAVVRVEALTICRRAVSHAVACMKRSKRAPPLNIQARDFIRLRHSRAHARSVLWCLRGGDLFAPAVARVPGQVIFCETWKDRDVLPAMEEGLKCPDLAAVVGEVSKLSLNASRRLQLCAGESGVTALVVRRWRSPTEREASAAVKSKRIFRIGRRTRSPSFNFYQ
jgi:hypothetical protein